MSDFWRKEYWTIKAIGEFGQCVGILAHEGDFFEKVGGLRPIRRFASMVLAANEVTRWRGMKHCGPGKSPSYKLVRHTVKAKPRGAKVGTWAWACEQMLAGKEVTPRGSERKFAIVNGKITAYRSEIGWHDVGIFCHMLLDTTWQVAP